MGAAISVMCSIVGLFLVLRRHSLFGDAMSHVAFGGIAIGLFTNVYPIWTAFIVSVLGAMGITKLRESTKIPADSAVAVLLSSGLAIGVVLISLSNGFTLDLYSLLIWKYSPNKYSRHGSKCSRKCGSIGSNVNHLQKAYVYYV